AGIGALPVVDAVDGDVTRSVGGEPFQHLVPAERCVAVELSGEHLDTRPGGADADLRTRGDERTQDPLRVRRAGRPGDSEEHPHDGSVVLRVGADAGSATSSPWTQPRTPRAG